MPMDDDGRRRELYLAFGVAAYVLRYRLDGDFVVIIRVQHSREHRESDIRLASACKVKGRNK